PEPDSREFKEDKTLAKYQFSWMPNDDMSFYMIASQGYRLGGTNQQGIVAVPAGYGADELWNYELGAKTSWLDNRYNVNLAFFRIEWDDLQVAGRDPTGAFGFIGNAGSAEVEGMEFEVVGRPMPSLEFAAGIAWLPTAELTEDQVTDQVLAPGREGDELPDIPELTANATVQFDYHLPLQGWEGYLRGEYSYKGSANSELDTGSRLNRRMNSYEIFNFRAGFGNTDTGWDFVFYVENAFDERGDVRVRTEDSLLTFNWTNPPRTVGVEITRRF
ncbi:MAG: TonB-dependent receptor domain-containing protein, partial [Parahaliea sp.]